MRSITIKPVMNGYIVEVGCATVVFETQKKLQKELAAYWDDPEKTEERYEKNAVNKPGKPISGACLTPFKWGSNE